MYANKVSCYDSFYIKNGKVDDVDKLIVYFKKLLNNSLIKRKYVFVLDVLLCNSDLFVYKYVFDAVGLLDYKIINDIELIKNKLTEDNIIILNWSSSMHYVYLNSNNEIVVQPININVINHLEKKYILIAGDTPLSNQLKIPVYHYEYEENVIFNFII